MRTNGVEVRVTEYESSEKKKTIISHKRDETTAVCQLCNQMVVMREMGEGKEKEERMG